MKRTSLLEVSKREEVSAFIAPDYAVVVAKERTGGMVNYFLAAVRGVSFITALNYIDRLAESAYLQGVNDAAIAMARMEKS